MCWLFLFTFPARAQYRFDHWTAETGLPQNIITAIHQTPEGYLWVATLDGLARFDGVRFTIFNKSNTPGISSNRFGCLYQDAQGDLWAGTEVGAITRYHQGKFITYANEHGLSGNVVHALTGDAEGHLWAFADNKVREWDQSARRFIERETPQFSGGANKVDWHRETRFWGVNQAGLYMFTSGNWTHLSLPAEVNRQIANVAKADDGTIWIATTDGRIFRLKDSRVTSFPLQNERVARPRTEWRDRAGKVWEMEIGKNFLRKLTILSSGQPESISLNTLYEDRDGNLWLGTDGQGLYRIRKQIVTTLSQEQGLLSRNVYPVYEDRAGTIWVGLWDGGLSQIKAGKITNFTTREGLSEGGVISLWEDQAGRLWVATTTDLQIFEQGRFTSVKAEYPPGRPRINVIYQDRVGAMWFGTDNGLFRHHNGQVQHLTPQDGLPGVAVRTIIKAADGGIWIGCYGGLMHWQDGKWKTWTEKDSLPGNAIRALYEDQDGVLWIGTYDSGLGRFKDGKFTRYTTREGLFNDGVFQILEDAYGNFWMSCNRGIYRVRKEELNEFAAGHRRDISSIAFGKNDGMRNVECNGGLSPAGTRSRDGQLWFPTQDGVAVIDPANIRINEQPPPVVIEAMKINRKAVAFEIWQSAIGQPHTAIEIGPEEENFEIDYTALSFINAENLRFKYKLEGLDHEWVDAGTRRTAYFSHVGPGSYTFKVIAANSDGVWNEEGKSLRITVLPPFYRTWWFLSLAVLSVTGAVFAAFKYRVRQLEQRQAAQQVFARRLIESQEAERKRIAAELHDGLGQNLLVIKNRALFGLLQPDDVTRATAQLTDISSTVSQALDEVRQIAANLHPYQLDQLGLTKALTAMIRKVGEAAQLEIAVMIDDLDGVGPERVLDAAAQINLYRIVQEGLNNIIKHAAATEVSVQLQRTPQSLHLMIRDNGRGFTPAGVQPASDGNCNFGLTGLAERARLLGGALNIESAPGAGTRVTLLIPLPQLTRSPDR